MGKPGMSDSSPYVPGAHVGGNSRLLPTGQREPAAHGLHDDAPDSFWYVDAGQSVHIGLPATDAWLPGLQAVGALEPVPHAWPSGHGEQSPTLVMHVAFEKLPEGHGRASTLLSGQ